MVFAEEAGGHSLPIQVDSLSSSGASDSARGGEEAHLGSSDIAHLGSPGDGQARGRRGLEARAQSAGGIRAGIRKMRRADVIATHACNSNQSRVCICLDPSHSCIPLPSIASLFRYLFPRLSQRYRDRLIGFRLDTLPQYKHSLQSRIYRFILERQRRRREQSRLVDKARRLLLGPPKPKLRAKAPVPRLVRKRDATQRKVSGVMSYLSGYGPGSGNGAAGAGDGDRGARRRRLAAMAGRVYSAGASAVSEIRESYNQTRAGQIDTAEVSKITIPGSFPEVAIVTKGNEQMVLFPSYAKRHVKGQARMYEDPAGPPHPASVDVNEEEYWRQEWARHEDEKAIVDVDVRGWIYNPHKGPMTRRNRVLIGLARQLSGIPVPRTQQGTDQSPQSLHQQHEEEREQMRIAQEAKEIEQRGQAEKEAAQRGGYSEAPKDPDSEDDASGIHHLRQSATPTPSLRSRPGSPKMGINRTNSAGGTELSEAELAVANANLMARIAPFMTTPLVQMPITVFFYNDSQSQSRTVMTNDSGHFILRAPLDFVPTHLRVLANEDLSATEPIQIIEPKGISLISDIDDTIKHSSISMGAKEIFRNTFIRDLGDLTVPGVREWYGNLHGLGVRIHYCSNSPWQLFPVIASYFKLAGLPPGSIHLKQYSGMLQGIFEPVAERKKGTLEKIMHDFPERRFVLVGDSGEADLEVYTEIAVANPGRIVAIFIRDVTTPEQAGYFDSGYGGVNGRDERRAPGARGKPGSRSDSSDDKSRRPALPPRPASEFQHPARPVTEDLIDFSDEPQQLPRRGSQHIDELQEELGGANSKGKKPPPPRPAKPVSLKSSPATPVMGSKDVGANSEQKRPPPPPQARRTEHLSGPAMNSSTSHPLAQIHNSSQQSIASRPQAPPRIRTQEDISASSSTSTLARSGAPPPPPPPRRRGTPSSTMPSSSPRIMAANRRSNANSDVESIDPLPQSSYPNNAYNGVSPSEAPLNKKLDLWLRRLQRAQETLERQGVALYTWRRGSDVVEEALGIVRGAMKEMGIKEGEGEIRELKNKR
ncbi:hypothetical protein JX266_004677 [Neoarthrinium moseri]|nr:hypothetical protein JX266_004677 [Neoarthrinium moseri]